MYQVLYVQKNEDIARHFMEEFMSSEYNLLIANTGEEALSIIEETDVLLLLIDINISDMRIRRLIQKAKDISPGIIVNVCIDVCDYKLITKLVNRYGVHKIYVAPWNISEIIYEIGDSVEVALINEEVQIKESKLVKERTSLDETIVHLRNALTKQQYSYEKIKQLTDCFMEGVKHFDNSAATERKTSFLEDVFNKYLKLMTTGNFSIEELESGIKADLDELKAGYPGLEYIHIVSCFFGGVTRTDATNCRYVVWLIARLFAEFYANVTIDVKSHFTTTTEAKVTCTVGIANPFTIGEAKAEENSYRAFVDDVLCKITFMHEVTDNGDKIVYQFIVNVKDD